MADENTKLPASDGFRHPYPFRDMTGEGALNEELSILHRFFVPYLVENLQGLGDI